MNILVIGSGGREHALCWKISKSNIVNKIYCAPGNGGTSTVAENVPINSNDIDRLLDFAVKNKIDLTIVGPEEPLVMGIVDRFNEKGLRIFGPNKSCARLEASKEFSKIFMEKYKIPTAKYKSFTNYKEAIIGIEDYDYPLVIKADGLCLGKGVVICNNKEEAKSCLSEILEDKIFGVEGSKVVIEEFLEGIEASLLCLVSKGKIIPMESAKDYKRIFDNDLGPNTGGVGCYSPSPLFTKELNKKIEQNILKKIELGLNEEELDFTGILFIGFMINKGEPKVLEFNVRFGDPETEVLLPRLESDIVNILLKTIDGTLVSYDLFWSNKSCATVVLTSGGYPGKYIKGYKITGLDKIGKDIIAFHNSTLLNEGSIVTNGGRVISVTSLGYTIRDASNKIYRNIDLIKFNNCYYRKDIAT